MKNLDLTPRKTPYAVQSAAFSAIGSIRMGAFGETHKTTGWGWMAQYVRETRTWVIYLSPVDGPAFKPTPEKLNPRAMPLTINKIDMQIDHNVRLFGETDRRKIMVHIEDVRDPATLH